VLEAPCGRDEQVAALFRQMRLATGQQPGAIAGRLGISEAQLAAFEDGALNAMPDWPETLRIVTCYSRIVGIDCGPILRRIQAQRAPEALRHALPVSKQAASTPPSAAGSVVGASRAIVNTAHRPADHGKEQPAPAAAAPVQVVAVAASAPERKRRRPARTAFLLITMPMVIVGAGWALLANPSKVGAAIEHLPTPVADYARTGIDYLLASTAPMHGGLRLVDSGDPRSRKADKLPVHRRAR
jgi:hypothetical protein